MEARVGDVHSRVARETNRRNAKGGIQGVARHELGRRKPPDIQSGG